MKKLVIFAALLALMFSIAAIAGEEKPPVEPAEKAPAEPPAEPEKKAPEKLDIKNTENVNFDGMIKEGEYAGAASFEFEIAGGGKTRVYAAHQGGFLYLACDVDEEYIYSLSRIVIDWKAKGGTEQQFGFAPYAVRAEPLSQRLGTKNAEVTGWAAKADFTKLGRWHAEFKFNLSILALKPESDDTGEFSITVAGLPFVRTTRSGTKTTYPKKGMLDFTSTDKWGTVSVGDDDEKDLVAIQKNAVERKKETIRLMTALRRGPVGQIEEAAKALSKSNTNCFLAPFSLGLIEEQVNGKLKKAAEYYEKTLKINPSFGRARQNLADIYANVLGEKDKAVALYREIVDSDPEKAGFALAYVSFLGKVTYEFKKAAALAAEGAEKFADEKPMFLLEQGKYLFYANEFDNAARVLKEARQMAMDKNNVKLIQETNTFFNYNNDYKDRWAEELKRREADTKKDDLPRVKLETSRGDIVIELFEDDAPNTVANFLTLAEQNFYNETTFHRVICGFMVQGGDPLSRDDDPSNDGRGDPGYFIKTETSKRLHFRGVISMANSNRPQRGRIDTDGSQFFITTVHTPHLDGRHGVFGRVIEGMDVVDKISQKDVLKKVTVIRKRDHEYKIEKKEKPKTPEMPDGK